MFTYQVINEDELTIVLPEGELAYDVCNGLKDVLSENMGPGVLLSFNMEKVSFLDCAGIGFLVQMKKLAEKRNGSFEMRHLQKNAKLVLDILTMNEYLNVSPDAVSDVFQENE